MGASDHARAGARIDGKYVVESVIGAGGMGVVVAARHVALGTRVAIKLVRPLATRDLRVTIARFEREARIAAQLNSDHVVRVEDVGALPDGTPYMVMELLEGTDLRKLVLERGPLPVADAVGYLRQACVGVAEAHRAGIIHRDLNPSNLFLALQPDGASRLKVLDFGIARLTHDVATPSLTASAHLLGSVHYMSPEQMRSARTVDERSDVWSLGAILYELLTGGPAFAGDTMPETCAAVIFRPPPPIASARSDVPQRLEAIVHRCLAKRREERYASVDALAGDLDRFARELSVGTMPTVPSDTIPSVSVRVPPSQSLPPSSHGAVSVAGATPPQAWPTGEVVATGSKEKRRSGRRSWVMWIAAVEAVALVLVGGALIASRRAPRDNADSANTPVSLAVPDAKRLPAGAMAEVPREPVVKTTAEVTPAAFVAPVASVLPAAKAPPPPASAARAAATTTADGGCACEPQPCASAPWPWGDRQ
jgi:serine/threonine-protein kinase